MTRLRLLAPPVATAPTASAIVDLLWLHAKAGGGVSHIHARAGSHGFDVVVFTVARDQEAADQVARLMCDHAVRSVPCLGNWTVS
jgi:hypothetical protein